VVRDGFGPAAKGGSTTPGPPSTPRLSVVVLPFANIGGDPEQDYFVDGVTESLTTDLSRISGSFVIGRHTAFTYKGKAVDLKQIGRELNIRYVLEGSVQRGGNRLRVNVQLIDAETGNHLWAERFEKPVTDLFDMQDEMAWQTAFDPLLTPGAYNYWKSHNFVELSDGLLDTLAGHAARLPTAECEIFIGQLGGTTSRVAVDATAYPHRNANFVMNVHTRWREPADERRSIEWARQLFAETAPHATGGVYVNFMPEDEIDRVSSAYGANYTRLAALKAKYDPGNLFRLNQNVQPSAQRPAA
jgi:TolB-like protein